MSLTFRSNPSLRRDWLSAALATFLLALGLFIFAWHQWPGRSVRVVKKTIGSPAIEAQLSERLARLATQETASIKPQFGTPDESLTPQSVESELWSIALSSSKITSVEFHSPEVFFRTERAPGASRIRWTRHGAGQPVRGVRQSELEDRTSFLIQREDIEPTPGQVDRERRAASERWAPVSARMVAGVVVTRVGRLVDVAPLSFGAAKALLILNIALLDAQGLGLALPPVSDRPREVWLRDDQRGVVWALHDTSSSAELSAASLGSQARTLEWTPLGLTWMQASVGVQADSEAISTPAGPSWLWVALLIAASFSLLLSALIWTLRSRFESDARQLAAYLTTPDYERRNVPPDQFSSREFFTLAGVAKRQVQIALANAHKAFIVESEEARVAGADSAENVGRLPLEGSSRSAMQSQLEEKALRDAYAAARQWQSSYHKLRGRTEAELAAKTALIEHTLREKNEIETDYLHALGEIDAVKAQLKKAISRSPVAVSFKQAQILLLEENPIAARLFDNALAKLRYKADLVRTREEAHQAQEQIRYSAIIVGASSNPSVAHAVVQFALEQATRLDYPRPMIAWLRRHSGNSEAEYVVDATADVILHAPLDLTQLQLFLDQAASSHVTHDASRKSMQRELQPDEQATSPSFGVTPSHSEESPKSLLASPDVPPTESLVTASPSEPAESGARPSPHLAYVLLNMKVMEQHKTVDDGAPEGFMRPVIEDFARGLPKVISNINRCAASGQWDALARGAHKLRGTAVTLGAERLAYFAKALEAAAGQDASGDQVIALLDAFEEVAAASSEALLEAAGLFRPATLPEETEHSSFF